jgi:hypothetical protein
VKPCFKNQKKFNIPGHKENANQNDDETLPPFSPNGYHEEYKQMLVRMQGKGTFIHCE